MSTPEGSRAAPLLSHSRALNLLQRKPLGPRASRFAIRRPW